MRSPSQATGFLVSLAAHAVAVAAAVLAGTLPAGGCRTRPRELQIPIGVLVEEAPGREAAAAPAEPPPPEPPPPAPDETPLPPKPKPEKKPKPPEKKLEKKTEKKPEKPKYPKDRVVKRTLPPTTRPPKPATPPGRRMSADDIARMMNMDDARRGVAGGSPNGSPTAPVSQDDLLLARMQTTLYGVWCQPARSESGRRPAVIRLSLRPDGSFDAVLAESSGSDAMDRSALDAARGVRRFAFLTPDFVRRNPQVEIEFELKGQ